MAMVHHTLLWGNLLVSHTNICLPYLVGSVAMLSWVSEIMSPLCSFHGNSSLRGPVPLLMCPHAMTAYMYVLFFLIEANGIWFCKSHLLVWPAICYCGVTYGPVHNLKMRNQVIWSQGFSLHSEMVLCCRIPYTIFSGTIWYQLAILMWPKF